MSDSHKCDKCDKPATVHLTEIVDGMENREALLRKLCRG